MASLTTYKNWIGSDASHQNRFWSASDCSYWVGKFGRTIVLYVLLLAFMLYDVFILSNSVRKWKMRKEKKKNQKGIILVRSCHFFVVDGSSLASQSPRTDMYSYYLLLLLLRQILSKIAPRKVPWKWVSSGNRLESTLRNLVLHKKVIVKIHRELFFCWTFSSISFHIEPRNWCKLKFILQNVSNPTHSNKNYLHSYLRGCVRVKRLVPACVDGALYHPWC